MKPKRASGLGYRIGGVWFVGEGWTPKKVERVRKGLPRLKKKLCSAASTGKESDAN